MLMEGVSYLGELEFALALTAIAMLIFAIQRKWLEAIFMLATTSSVLLVFVLKDLIQRPRPFPLNQNAADSYRASTNTVIPAGMSYFLSSFLDFFAYLAWIHFAGWTRVIVIAICGALILLIGPSRVYLGAHWASDVLGSYIIGAIWLFILILAYQWVKRREIS